MKSVPEGYCQCGCGGKTNIAPYSSKKDGWIKGRPLRFIQGHQNRGCFNPRYNGGLCFNKHDKRWLIKCRDGTYVKFARSVMEAHLKRPLSSKEIVHHINGDSTDDRIENLKLYSCQSRHHSVGHYGYTKESLLNYLKQYCQETGQLPTTRKIKTFNWMPNKNAFYRHFGSFTNALKEAGLL